MSKPRRWIAQRIEQLDPETDYVEIWRLTITYGLDDFSANLSYTQVFPHFYIARHGAQPLWHEGDGKVVERATQRVEDTIRANLVWWHYGPHHPKTQKSVEGINKLHAFHAKRYPGSFAHQDDYVYTLAFSAASLHRLNLQLGLPGYTEKQKIAAHRFWREMGKLFVDEHGNAILDFPDDWDSMMAFLDDFENRPWPQHEEGRMVTHAILDQFAHRFFPRPLHGLARALAVSTMHPTTWRVHSMTPLPAPARFLLLRSTGLLLRLQQTLRPDPTDNYQEILEGLTRDQLRERSAGIRELDKEFSHFFRERHGLPPRGTSPEAAAQVIPPATSFTA
ncbi:hypothetical protein [Streptomyces griseorubiginosus]|uniref:hypothetical protein n=1 Tax=Streptomyces griseorubiginosus TaxID=67304 RepID=UPI00369D9369